jgi:hypothetical protein
MSPTLLEGAIAILLVWIAWRIGILLTPWFLHRFRGARQKPPGQKNKPPKFIDI